MPKSNRGNNEDLLKKLTYLGLNINNIPEKLKRFEPLEFRVSKSYNEKQYRQYRFIPVEDIQILLSPTNRLDTLEEKYKKARPIGEYLDNKNEENILKYTTFLNMLKNMKIEDIEKIEEEQNNLSKKIPFKVKYDGNYLWQIYYSENTDKYFMIVPTEDIDYSTFFYVLKKQLDKKKSGNIFVPISNVQYSNKYLKNADFTDLENYLWIFTKDWPLIYEVYDKNDNLSIQIIGETYVFEKIKTQYKIKLENKIEANKFYKLIKALFILQTELPNYYNFSTNISKSGGIEFYFDNKKIEYDTISKFIKQQFRIGLKRKKEVRTKIKFYNEKLEKLNELASVQEIEYLAKEKQISTFLECKKSFFGKFKYYFKYSKKSNKNNILQNKNRQESNINKTRLKLDNKLEDNDNIQIKNNYTLEELIENYKELENLEIQMKNVLMDLNAMKLKNKNLQKKIENATRYIQEIDQHKKSIFEFWKYSNKDELSALPEGEQEEINVIKKIEKVFDYEEDLEEFGKNLDKIQRKLLDRNDTDNIYIATTDLIYILNKIKRNKVTPEEIKNSLHRLKKEAIAQKALMEKEEFDIFGSIIEDRTKVKKIKNKTHRELPKDKFNILDINKNTNQLGYKLTLEQVVDSILKSIKKVPIPESLSVYKAANDNSLDSNQINIFDINPEKELDDAIKGENNNINLYKINIKEGTKGVGFTNIIFYDNQNRTLPLGMDLSSKIIIDTTKLHLKLSKSTRFNVVKFENEKDEFSNINIKTITLLEYDIIETDVID